MLRRNWIAIAVLASTSLAGNGTAQRAKKDGPEFTKQSVLVVNFAPGPGADVQLGRRAADIVRARAARLINNDREVEVIDNKAVVTALEHAGYNPDSMYAIDGINALARLLRADEIIVGQIANGPAGTTIHGELILTRDPRLRQPLPAAVAPKFDSAAVLFAKAIHAARAQLLPQRRCENALHDGSGSRALAMAREGIAAYPRSTIARLCLIWSLNQTHAPAAEVLDVSRQILAIDSGNVHAIEFSAIALDSLKRRDDAAKMWLRFAATDTTDVDLAVRVAYALLDDGNAVTAEPFVTHVLETHPDNLFLLRQRWRAAYENHHWDAAIQAGEIMLARDSSARGDSTFYLRLGTAYHSANLPLKAVETLSHGVTAFPKDSRLYSLYAQYVRAEADTVVPRGLALFPRSADLAVMSAKELRSKGKVAESLDATKRAVELDSTMAQGRLMVAQLELELGRPDSALVALHRAVAGGEDSTLVAQFALSKGNGFYRAASTTKASADFGLAMRFVAFADTIHSSTQSRFLMGATALGVAQSALTEATKVTDKAESCRLAQLGASMIPVARAGLEAGVEAYGDAAAQSLAYLTELTPYADKSVGVACSEREFRERD